MTTPLERHVRAGASVLLRRTRVPAATLRGDAELASALRADARDLAMLCDGDALPDLTGALFLDTETTGLGGGAGTHVFLLGLASFVREDDGTDHFEVRQWVLPDPADEAALLDVLVSEAAAARLVVTFHGRGFDLPLLEERCMLGGVRFPLARHPHIDLLVGARRVLKLRARRASLQTLEREILMTTRADDLPGAECPAAWFSFLRGDAAPMERVLEHNLLDLLSLPALAGALAAAARGDAPPPDVHQAGRVLAKAGAESRALGLQRLAASGAEVAEDGVLAAKAYEEAARLLRRAGESVEAAAAAIAATLADPGLPGPWVFLAKHHEHRTGDLDLALECARRAERCLFLRSRSAAQKRDAAARIARLAERIARRPAAAEAAGGSAAPAAAASSG